MEVNFYYVDHNNLGHYVLDDVETFYGKLTDNENLLYQEMYRKAVQY